jgi:tyrosine-protein kinase Etk/Wzc
MRHAMRRYRWLIVLLTLASLAIGVLITRVARPIYTADTMLWIDGGTRGEAAAAGPVRPRQVFDAEAWSSLLRSYAVLEGVVHDARLFVESRPADATLVRSGMVLQPRFVAGDYRLAVDDAGKTWTLELVAPSTVLAAGLSSAAAPASRTEYGAVGDSVGRAFGIGWQPAVSYLWAGRDVRFTIVPPRQAAAQLREALAVRIDEQANFLSVELTGPDPLRLASTLNALGARYVAQAGQLQRQNLAAYREILDVQLQSARDGLSSAERSLENFRRETATIPLTMESVRGAPGVGGDAYYGVLANLETVRRDRAALESTLAGPADKRNELRALRYRYADGHPALQRILAEIATLEKEVIPPLATDLSAQLRSRERALEASLASNVTTLRGIPARDREEGRLRRNVLLASSLFESLQMRADGTRLAEEGAVAEVRVLDRAVSPVRPTKDNQPAILLFSFFGGLLMTSGLAVALDRSDKRFRYPEQVTKDLGLTILGAVPHLRADAVGLVQQRGSSPFQEAMRDIRLNLAYAHGLAGPLVLTISSPGSNDGKSFLAANLARTFAESGARTLLIDGDLRRGQLNERFSLPRRPGMSEFLRGTHGRSEVVLHSAIPRLDFIPSGGRHRDAAELLGDSALARLLADLQDSYDVILCDSPPLSAGVDAVLLGAATGNMLLVVRTGVSQREVAAARLEVIGRMPVRVMGAILNDVPDSNAFSYYSHYSLPGYEARSEEEPVTTDAR